MKGHTYNNVMKILEIDTAQATTDHAIYFSSGSRIFQRLLVGLLPSFTQRSFRPSSSPISRIQQKKPTAYLDGLRGIASFIVFMGHYTEENIGWYQEPYGMYEDGAPSSLIQLPFVRVIYSARPMVHIFFVISGYVLSLKALQQIHSQQYSSVLTTLSSSIFRRFLRLFLPSFVGLFIMAVSVHYGISDDRYAGPIFGLYAQLQHCWAVGWGLLQVTWAINDPAYPQPAYNPALWTIPVEFAQSLILFTVLVGLSRCLTNARLLITAGLMMFCFWSGKAYSVEFLGGMLLAEINLCQDSSFSSPLSSPTNTLPSHHFETFDEDDDEYSPTAKHTMLQVFWILNLVCGLFLCSWTNNHAEEVWGLRFFNAHTPAPYEGQGIWFCVAAFQIVIACTQLKPLQQLLTTPLPQYLGSISYALYLTHNICLSILEPSVSPIMDRFLPKTNRMGRQLSWIVGLIMYLPILISVADLFWRVVDIPTVSFAKWLEKKCIAPKKA